MERIGLRFESKTGHQREEKKECEQLLDEVTFDGIAKYIQSDKCKNVLLTYVLYSLVHVFQVAVLKDSLITMSFPIKVKTLW